MLYLYSFCHSLNRAEVFSCLWIDIHGANIISRNLSRDIVAYSSKCAKDLVVAFLSVVLCGRSWRPQGSEKRQRIFLSQTSVIPPGVFCTSYKRRFFLLKEMSTSQQPSKEFMLHFLLFITMRCASTSRKDCKSFNAADYIGEDTKGLNFAFGDCSFKKTFCNYKQSCTNGVARNWTTSNGGAVCPGKTGLYDSFSVLLSPLLNITQNTLLVFNFSQTTPGTLSVFIATTTEIKETLKEAVTDGSFHKELNIEPGVVKIGFRARTANTGGHVTLSYVKLQTGTFTSITSKPEATSGSNVGVTVGVVVAIVVGVAAGVVVGFFIWRRRKQRENGKGGQKTMKDGQNSYQSADTGNISPALTGMPSHCDLSTNQTVNSENASHKATPGILGIRGNQYDVPPNRVPQGQGAFKYEQSRPSELTSPTGDDEEGGYNTIEEDSARATLSPSSVYSYARNEGLNTSSSNNPEGNYDRTDPLGVISLSQGKSTSAPPEDDYNHILSTDISRKKIGQLAGEMEPNHIWERGRGEHDCGGKTSSNDDDGYSVLCAGNKQLSEFNGQQAVETYDHVGGDVHGDYDRIRQGDHNDVIGSDYDHLI